MGEIFQRWGFGLFNQRYVQGIFFGLFGGFF